MILTLQSEMISINISNLALRTKNEKGKTYVYDTIRNKWLLLTKEEHVRQLFIQYLIHKGYPATMIAVEKMIMVGDRKKRFDIVVYDNEHKPWMLVECKEPDEKIAQHTLFQLLNYQRVVQSSYWVLTNGPETLCADATTIENIKWLEALPAYSF